MIPEKVHRPFIRQRVIDRHKNRLWRQDMIEIHERSIWLDAEGRQYPMERPFSNTGGGDHGTRQRRAGKSAHSPRPPLPLRFANSCGSLGQRVRPGHHQRRRRPAGDQQQLVGSVGVVLMHHHEERATGQDC